VTAVIIYALFDPREPSLVRYIGKTSSGMAERLSRHLTEARLGLKAHRFHWIRALLRDDVMPRIRQIEETTAKLWRDRERHWIEHFRCAGHPMTNTSNGGDGLDSEVWRKIWEDPALRKRQSSALRRYCADPLVRMKKSRDGKRRYADPAERARTGEALRRMAKAPGERARRSAATAASWSNSVIRSKRSEGIRKAFSTPQAKQRLSKSKVRMWQGADQRRAAQSIRMLERWADPKKRAATMAAMKMAAASQGN
jgi:hypothetical protein